MLNKDNTLSLCTLNFKRLYISVQQMKGKGKDKTVALCPKLYLEGKKWLLQLLRDWHIKASKNTAPYFFWVSTAENNLLLSQFLKNLFRIMKTLANYTRKRCKTIWIPHQPWKARRYTSKVFYPLNITDFLNSMCGHFPVLSSFPNPHLTLKIITSLTYFQEFTT